MRKRFYKTTLIFLFSCLPFCVLFGQANIFKLLTFSGMVEIKNPNSQTWNKLNVGEYLSENGFIRLGKNSSAFFMQDDGSTLELYDKGEYSYGELKKKFNQKKISVGQKYLNYIAKEILSDKSAKKDMKTFAAVVRVKPNHIEASIPAYTSLLKPSVLLTWHSYPSTDKYVLSILTADNTTIFMQLVDDTSFTLDFEKLNLSSNKIYKWYVFDSERSNIISDTNSVMLLSSQHALAILDTLQMINTEFNNNKTPFYAFALGTFFEKNSLNIDAMDQFEKALDLAPDSEELKKLYSKFLLNNKLYVRITEVLEDKTITE